ncbi:SEC14-like protein 2 [Drosophila persimilis]|uniref:SEC14-like protein 2 n=1 Tax=Drosophila pseudoobscura pseudoobscura TaxID=46245 RepID=Q29FF8_DROPS|nr:SEC14-like protein 2 [Drosophila pseudoobscura]XP_026849436.1 SEC14-like protein 2 [Drosophila persimilis]
MSGPLPEISAEQRATLEQFRKQMDDALVDTHDDYFLLRWLRARKWNLEAAEKMLRASLKTRAMWNVDNIDKWDPPKALKEYLPYGLIGYDNEGSPLLVCPFYNFDIWGMMHCVTRFEFQKYLVLLIERFMKTAYEQSLDHGWKARQLVVFFDMQDVNLKQYAWRPAAECVISSVKQYEANFPELLKMCYIINAPKLFSVAFNIVKKFLDENTTSKIVIYKSGVDKWQQQLFSHVNPKVFPKAWGGELVDKLGDPQCKSMMVWGGKLPEDLFIDQNSQQSDKDFTDTQVPKGDKLKLHFKVNLEEQKILSWEFRTIDYDIKFGIYSVDEKSGEKRSEVPLGTVYSNEMDEIGYISTRPNTTYTVVFDNSASYLRGKKLRYWVDLVSDEEEGITELTNQMDNTQLAAQQ